MPLKFALDFDEEAHAYYINGVRVPSVTQLLKPLSDLAGIPPDILERKRDLGSRVHYSCQLDDEADLDEDSVEEDVAPYLLGYRRFRRESGAIVLLNEQRVAEPRLGFAGTLDRVFSLKMGREWRSVLVDLKTSFSVPLAAGAQTAGYMRALGDPSVTHRAALRLRPDGSYRLDPLPDPNDWSVFMACLTMYKYVQANRGI